jgi:hypothetical protein
MADKRRGTFAKKSRHDSRGKMQNKQQASGMSSEQARKDRTEYQTPGADVSAHQQQQSQPLDS